MKKPNYLIALALGASTVTFAQNVGINTDGSDPDSDAILHINNHSGSSADSSIIRIENEQNGANDVTGVEIYNSGTGNTARWDVYIPASGSTDLRIKNNGTDRITIQNDGDVGIGTTSPVSGLDVQTSLGYAVTTITSATTLNQTHNVVLCNSGPYTVTLPPAADNTGKVYYIKNFDADAEPITIDGNGAETIEGYTNLTLNVKNHVVRIVSDGSNWHILEESYEVSGYQDGRTCDGAIFTWNDVISPVTGKAWMDRNLGASQVATSTTDADSYGDLYQWGRLNDGHQCRNSATINTLSTGIVPGHDDFIRWNSEPHYWNTSGNDNLWQGVNGINNPCPYGYRVPTKAEWDDEIAGWADVNDAHNSFLELPLTGGFRRRDNGLMQNTTSGYYWASTYRSSDRVDLLVINETLIAWNYWHQGFRTSGAGVRCIKD